MGIADLGREVCILAPNLTLAVAVSADDVRRLWAAAVEAHGAAWLRQLNGAADRSDSLDILVSDEQLSLWLGETRISVVSRLAR